MVVPNNVGGTGTLEPDDLTHTDDIGTIDLAEYIWALHLMLLVSLIDDMYVPKDEELFGASTRGMDVPREVHLSRVSMMAVLHY